MSNSGIEGYRGFLIRRDGEADLLHRRLGRREKFFSALETDPIHSSYPIDRDMFLRNLRRRRPEPAMDPKRSSWGMQGLQQRSSATWGIQILSRESVCNVHGLSETPRRLFLVRY